MSKMVGYRRFVSKKNRRGYCVVNVVTDYSDREIKAGCIGQKTEEIFLPDEYVDMLQPEDVGRDISFSYDVSGGRAYLVGIDLK